jgi:hypothetical protein
MAERLSQPETATAGKICWLASYPRSGNTWLRTLLANYQADGDRPVDINTLRSPGAAARGLFDEWVGLEASALDADTIDNLRPAVYRCAVREETGLVFVKVHDMFRRNNLGQVLFPREASAGAVYIVRNVLDVALSLAQHAGVDAIEAVEMLCDPCCAISRSEGKLDDQLRQVLGSWSGHISSWLDQTEMPVHCVRYERLLDDPMEVFAGVVRFCGLPFDEDRLRRAVRFSSFSELRRQECAHGFRERPEYSSASFFRRGEAGRGARDLPRQLSQRLIEAHGAMLRRFDYLPEPHSICGK